MPFVKKNNQSKTNNKKNNTLKTQMKTNEIKNKKTKTLNKSKPIKNISNVVIVEQIQKLLKEIK